LKGEAGGGRVLSLSTGARYGLRAAGRPVALSQIVKRQRIPEPCLRQILFSLEKAGVVESAAAARALDPEEAAG
jgi:DNA-binding IscR family transcriptional regulator